MSHSRPSLDDIFESHIQSLALSLRPDTVVHYRTLSRCFLSYLHSAFPQMRSFSPLRRDPHLLGWFRWLCERQPTSVQRDSLRLPNRSPPPVPRLDCEW